MKSWVNRIILVLVLGSAILLCFSTYLTYQVFRDNSDFLGGAASPGDSTLKYHLSLVLPNDTDFFFQRLFTDLKSEAKNESALEVFTYDRSKPLSELMDFLDKSIYAKVDGILLCVRDEPGITELINRAVDRSIPVVCLVYDNPGTRRQTFVGTNSYQWGFDLGKLLNKQTSGTGSAVILLNNSSPLLLSGFQNFLKEKPQSGTVAIRQAEPLPGLESEEMLWEILSRNPPETLICTNLRDTLSAVQMLIELNRVGKTAIIGFDDTQDTRDLIKKGLLLGTMVPKSKEIARESYQALIQLIKKESVSSFINVDLTVLSKETLSERDQGVIRGR